MVRQLRTAGATVLLVEHNMDFVMAISDAVTVLDHGVRIAEGPPAAVQQDQAVIGANGAGKTTLLRAISGLVPLQVGRIRFDGADITGRPAHSLARTGLVHVPQGRQVVPGLSVEENLLIGTRHLAERGDVAQRLRREYQRFPILRERAALLAGALSGGEQQMLAISRG